MNNVWLLTKVLLKNALTPLQKKKSKRTRSLVGLLLVIGLIIGLVFPNQYDVAKTILATGNEIAFFNLNYLVLGMMILFTALYMVPTTFYFAQDNSFLLAQPLKSWQIVLAKLNTVGVTCLLYGSIFLLPFATAGLLESGWSFGTWLLYLFEIILFIMNLLLGISIVMILLFALMPKGMSKDGFSLIIGIFTLLFSVIFGALIGFMTNGSSVIVESGALDIFSYLGIHSIEVLPIYFSNLAIQGSIPAFLFTIFWTALWGALFYLTANKFYLKAAMKAEGNSKKRTKTKTVRQSMFWSMCKVRMKLILRSPSYLINIASSVVIVPLVFIGVMWLLSANLEGVSDMIRYLLAMINIDLKWIILLCGILISFYSSAFNFISCTSFSRDGQNLYFYKVIPMSVRSQINARLLVSSVFTLITIVLFAYPVYKIFTPTMIEWICYFVGAIPGTFLCLMLGLWIDAFHPYLIWENETQSSRGNINTFIYMVCIILLSALISYLGVQCIQYDPMYVWIFWLILLGVDMIVYRCLLSYVVKKRL